jgi:rubrerythrin
MKYCYSTNEENYHGDFETRDEALSEARAMEPDEVVYTAQCVKFVPHISVNDVFDQLMCEAVDHSGEVAEEWLSFTPKEERQELEDCLNGVLNLWMEKTNNKPHFYGVVDVQRHEPILRHK